MRLLFLVAGLALAGTVDAIEKKVKKDVAELYGEDALRGHLEKSKSLSQFLDRLDKAGYDVRPAR